MLTPSTVSDRTEDVQITSQPPLSTLRPHLPIPEVLPPSGTPINIPCGMFDPVQVKQGILQWSPPPLDKCGWLLRMIAQWPTGHDLKAEVWMKFCTG